MALSKSNWYRMNSKIVSRTCESCTFWVRNFMEASFFFFWEEVLVLEWWEGGVVADEVLVEVVLGLWEVGFDDGAVGTVVCLLLL